MVLTISQKTYEDAVRELMEELELSYEEAIEEANKQFEAQGVDLAKIVKSLTLPPESDYSHAIEEACQQLAEVVKSEEQKPSYEYLERLSVIKRECDKGIEYRVIAGKNNAYHSILRTMDLNSDNRDIIKECLKAMLSLMNKQPDLLDQNGIQTIITLLEKEKDPEIQRLVLKWTRQCCIMHEMNRQNIYDSNILEYLKPLLGNASTALIRDVLAILRALVLDDDVRVEFGKAHVHAKAIAGDTLPSITALLSNLKGDEPLMNDLMLTIAALLVRQEFCQQVEEAGGLEVIKEVLLLYKDNEKLVRQSFKLIKALSGSDSCKINFVSKGGAPVLLKAVDANKSSPQTVAAGFGAIAALTLRAPDNSKTLFDTGAADLIVECMSLHPEDLNVQKNACWAVRNMVSRSRYQTKTFLKLGIENILRNSLKLFPAIEFDTKSALRDLGCKVELKEEWTGKGGLLSSQANTNDFAQDEPPKKCPAS